MHINRTIRIKLPIVLSVLALILTTTLPALADTSTSRDTLLSKSQWRVFNERLITALHSDNIGVRECALRHIAYYGDQMDFPQLSVFEVMRVYRNHNDANVKRLAIVALGNMGSRWAIAFLDMLAPYEDNDALRKTMESVVREA